MNSLIEKSLNVGVNQKVIEALKSANALADFVKISDKSKSHAVLAHRERVKEALRVYSSLSLLRSPIEAGYVVIFLLFALTMLIIAFLASIIISKKLTLPLKELIKGLENVTNGNLDFQVQIATDKDATSSNEMNKAVNSFNLMVKELKDSRQRLIEAERESAWRGIAQRIAHEIKNPLTPIQLSLEHLRDKLNDDPQRYKKVMDRCIGQIGEEVETLRKMAEEFSEFAKMPEPNFQISDINSLLRDVLTIYLNSNVEVNYEINLPRVKIDKERIKIVFKNILQNAIDAIGAKIQGQETKDKWQISSEYRIFITTSLDNKKIKIEFQDNGAGMDEETKSKIFTPYFSNKERGMGLGLTIVQKIINDHNGKILVQSKLGQGTTFTIFLPV